MTGAADYDAIVVGAGPAGSAIGILLAEEGMSVLVLDRATFPRSKMCGEYLSPETARILHRLGVLDTVDRAGAVPLWGMSITGPDGSRIVGTYPTTGRWRGYRDHALAIPRATFDAILTDRPPRDACGFPGEVSRDRSDHGRQSGRGCRGLRPRGSAPALSRPARDRRGRAQLRGGAPARPGVAAPAPTHGVHDVHVGTDRPGGSRRDLREPAGLLDPEPVGAGSSQRQRGRAPCRRRARSRAPRCLLRCPDPAAPVAWAAAGGISP